MAVQDRSRGQQLLQKCAPPENVALHCAVQVPPVENTFNDDDTATRSCLEQYQLTAAERQDESEATRNTHGLSPGEFAPPGVVISLFINNYPYTVNRVQAVPQRAGPTLWIQKVRTAAEADLAEAAASNATQDQDTKAAVPDSSMPAPVPESTADSQAKEDEAPPDEPMPAVPPVVSDASQVKDEPMPESTNCRSQHLHRTCSTCTTRTTNNLQNTCHSSQSSTHRMEIPGPQLQPPVQTPQAPIPTQTHTIATPRDNLVPETCTAFCRHSPRSRSK